jgi:hypothetical protein
MPRERAGTAAATRLDGFFVPAPPSRTMINPSSTTVRSRERKDRAYGIDECLLALDLGPQPLSTGDQHAATSIESLGEEKRQPQVNHPIAKIMTSY